MSKLPNPVLSGLFLKCGECGKGKIFRAYLKPHESCSNCEADFAGADAADGPAFFVGFFVLILMAPFYFILPMTKLAMIWKVLGFVIISVIVTGLCLALLPIAKAILMNLQMRHRAGKARFDN